MGTRGFIGFTKDGATRYVYNHMDSYPSWLGVKMIELVRDHDMTEVTAQVFTLDVVDEQDKPTPAQLEDLKARDFWQNVSHGDDWYSALRSAQGQPLEYIKAGYWPDLGYSPLVETNNGFEWGYIVNADTQTLDVYQSAWNKLPAKILSLSFEEIGDHPSPEFLMAFEGAY